MTTANQTHGETLLILDVAFFSSSHSLPGTSTTGDGCEVLGPSSSTSAWTVEKLLP